MSKFGAMKSDQDDAKNNFEATSIPSVNDDSSLGYTVGSRWIDTSGQQMYICTGASIGEAIWKKVTDQGGGSPEWGAITGSLSSQTDLNGALNGKEPANANIQTHVGSAHAPSNAQKNSDITKAEIEAKLTGEISTHTHAGGGTPVPLYIPIAVPVLAALVWTNMPAALSFFLSTATVAKSTTRVDLTGYTQVRLLVNKQGTSGAAASKLILRYKAAPFTQVVANYSNIGTSEVSVAINVNNTFLDTGWINLAAGAKADVFIDLLGQGGDGALDPAFGYISAVFK